MGPLVQHVMKHFPPWEIGEKYGKGDTLHRNKSRRRKIAGQVMVDGDGDMQSGNGHLIDDVANIIDGASMNIPDFPGFDY